MVTSQSLVTTRKTRVQLKKSVSVVENKFKVKSTVSAFAQASIFSALRLNSVNNDDVHFKPIKPPEKVATADISAYVEELYGVIKECVQDFQEEESVFLF